MQAHTELSYYYLHYTEESDRETHPSESANINGLYLTPEIFILPAFNPPPRLCSLTENRNADIYLVALSHGQINISRNSDTTATGATTPPELIFSPKKVIAQQGSIKETTKTWIPGFQLHTEQQTKGTGLASALNQGQMQLLHRDGCGGGWKRGSTGLNAAQPQREAPVGLGTGPKPSPPLPSPTSINCAGVALPKQCCSQKSSVPELGSVQVGFESGA